MFLFGLYRTLLALLVAISHLLAVPTLGTYAVHGFFILSGFLMTYVMQEKYGYTGTGRIVFAKARALRLYPSWFVVAIFAIVAIAVMGDDAKVFRAKMYLPSSPSEWLQNATFLFLDWFPHRVEPRLSPATWALTTEIFYYALICLGISRCRSVTWAWFAAGAAYHLWADGMEYQYFHILSGSLPFSVGALIYHYKDELSFPVDLSWGWAILGAAVVFPLALFEAFYVNMVVTSAFIVALLNCEQSSSDARLGEFSYHIYILHWPMGLVVYSALGFSEPGRTVLPFLATVTACLLASAALSRWVDEPVKRWKAVDPVPAP